MIEMKLQGGVARIFLNRPEKANALTSALLSALAAQLAGLKSDPSLRVVVLSGRGKAFSGGADVNELASLTRDNAAAFVAAIHQVCLSIRTLEVPVVASLHGACIGGALEIAAACDLRVAAAGTKFAMPEVRLGIPSVVEAALLPRLMGTGRAAWLVLTGEAIDAARACEWGLVEEVCSAERLEERTALLVDRILAGERGALAAQKRLLQLWDEAPLARSVDESLRAFAQAFAQGTTISSRLKSKAN
jgi:enoyl-CoA hydratase/carnithine racemase